MSKPMLGHHLLIDLFGASRLDSVDCVERAMREAVAAIGATLLGIDLHRFGGGGGVTGVATLAESHISVHTWPESRFAAIDVFVCGELRPEAAIDVFRDAFSPDELVSRVVERGG